MLFVPIRFVFVAERDKNLSAYGRLQFQIEEEKKTVSQTGEIEFQ